MKKLLRLLLARVYKSEVHTKTISATEVFEQLRQSVVVLEERDDQGNILRALTAVAVSKDSVVTLCDAQAFTHDLWLLVNKKPIKATVTARDNQRNLWLLSAPGAGLSVFNIRKSSAIKSGERVFAVSNALGLGIGISEGVISGVRRQFGADYIQFSAPVSPGSDGGALIDVAGRLLGIISYRHRDGQNVNFAIPAKWLAQIEKEDKANAKRQQFLESAESLEQKKLWPELVELAEHWLVKQPNDADAWRLMAMVAEQTGDLDAEERACRKFRELQPSSIMAGAGLVRIKLKRGLGSEALKQAYELLSIGQENADIWAIIGETEQSAGTLAKAEQAYRQAISFNPWQINAYRGLISLAERRNDCRTITQLWRRLVALNPDDVYFQIRLGEAFLREGRPARAYSLLQKLCIPEQLKGHAGLLKGDTLAMLGRPLAATLAFQECLQAEFDGKAWAYEGLGRLYFDLQRFPESIQAYREAVALSPDNEELLFGLARSLKDGGYAEEALLIDEQLLIKHPDNPMIWRQKAFSECTLGRYREGLKSLEKSLELHPTQGDVWMALIETYRIVGRDDDARSAYEKLRGIDFEWAEKAYRKAFLPFEAHLS